MYQVDKRYSIAPFYVREIICHMPYFVIAQLMFENTRNQRQGFGGPLRAGDVVERFLFSGSRFWTSDWPG